MFADADLFWRPPDAMKRGRSVLEQMVHQCVSEDLWFKNMLGIDLGRAALPKQETRMEFLRTYADAALQRLDALRQKPNDWWEAETAFFGVRRPRTWILVRRMTHSAHHRGQLTAYLRTLGRELYSTYGPTADTGGLMAHGAAVVYPYDDSESLLEFESAGGKKHTLPGVPKDKPFTERPEAR